MDTDLRNPLQYTSYATAHQIDSQSLVVVDCHYPRGLILGHRIHQRVPELLRSNTSTEAAMKYLALPEAERATLPFSPQHVTCNHWDIDGFLALWSLLNPRIALRHREALIAAAELGDFREFDPGTQAGVEALKICALLNAVEAHTFCLPFGDLGDATIEYAVADQKFKYFLSHFAQWLERIDDYAYVWQREFDEVLGDLAYIDAGHVSIEEHSSIGLTIVRTQRPLHYYASWTRSKGGCVMTVVASQRYAEAEYKYETRVGRVGRVTAPRVDLSHLAERLTGMESEPEVRWAFDTLNDGGPILRPEFVGLSIPREARYQNMRYRLENYPNVRTSIDPRTLIECVTNALRLRVAEPVARSVQQAA